MSDLCHQPPTSVPTGAWRAAIALNLAFVLLEGGFGWASGSLALLADAGHNLGDVLALAVGAGAARLASARATERHTYGLRRATILGALVSAVLLLIALAVLVWEAVGRFGDPALPPAGTIMAVAAAGVGLNGATALLFLRGRERDLNRRAVFQHMLADAGVSLGVVLAGAAIAVTGKAWLDPAMSLLVVAAVLASTWRLVAESVDLALDAVPRHIDPAEVRAFLAGQAGVTTVHDLHIWAMSTTDVALTAHLVLPGGMDDAGLEALAARLRERFGIGHVTIQVERGGGAAACVGPLPACE